MVFIILEFNFSNAVFRFQEQRAILTCMKIGLTITKTSSLKNFCHKVIVAVLSLFFLTRVGVTQELTTAFTRYGAPVQVSEARGVLAVRNSQGAPLIAAFARDRVGISVRISLIVLDPLSGQSQQYWYPNREVGSGDSFASLRGANGRLYTTIGSTFLEFDLDKRQWSFEGKIDGMAMSFTPAPNGQLFFATFPNATLYRFDPQTRVLDELGRLDDQEKYVFTLAAGSDGWVYAGIGTARGNLVGFNPQTRRRVQFAEESARKRGSGHVYLATDGVAYGRALDQKSSPLFKLQNGVAAPMPENVEPPYAVTGAIRLTKTMLDFPGEGKVTRFDLGSRVAEVELGGKTKRISFDYDTSGAGLSGLAIGPDGKLYGSSNHPAHLFTLDPATGVLHDFGSIPSLGGGNFPGFATSGQFLVGATYGNGGAFYEYDTMRPWNPDSENPETMNPRMLRHFKEVQRPRSVVKLDNGKILFGGYGGYGVTGGGILIYDSATRAVSAKSSDELLPGHSPIALARADAKTIVGGTTIEAPGGGRVLAKEAELFLMNADTLEVTYRTVPIPGANAIYDLAVGDNGLVYGLTNRSQLFVFDLKTRKIVHKADWSAWGSAFNPGNPLWRDDDGRIYGLLSNSLVRLNADFTSEKLAGTPVTVSGGGIRLNNRVYFVSGSELYSADMTKLRGAK